jgi:sec-independent protein translocase protein TatB
MFGIGMTELLVILVVGLLVLGPKRLPGLARSLGRSLAEFRRASNDIRREFMDVAEEVRMEPPSLSDAEPPAQQAKAQDDAEAATPDGAAPDETPADPQRTG